MRDQFQGSMLRIHFGGADQWEGKPLHEVIIAKCKELGTAAAIAYRGIEGYGTSTRIRHANHWIFSKDAPIMLSIIDTEEQINKLIPYLDAILQEGLVAMSRVEVIRYSRIGKTSPPSPPK